MHCGAITPVLNNAPAPCSKWWMKLEIEIC